MSSSTPTDSGGRAGGAVAARHDQKRPSCRDGSTGKPPERRASKAGRWRAGVLIGVHVLIAIHIAHWISTGSTLSPLEPSEAMEFSKRSIVNAGLVLFALATLSTLVLGRWFCGWACHLVALQDLCRWMLLKVGLKPKPLRSRALAIVPLLAFGYMFLLPIGVRLWTGSDLGPVENEMTRSGFWDTFPGPVISILTFVVCGFVCVYFLGSKGFCTYACPYGALFGIADRFSPARIRVTDACEQCGHCTATCSSNVRVHEEVWQFGAVVDPGCMKCMDCVSVCPKDALYFGFGSPALTTKSALTEKKPRVSGRPTRVEEGLLVVTFGIALTIFYKPLPFLFALGLAGCLAFLALVGWRALRRPEASLLGWRIKSGGRFSRRGGLAFGALMLAVALLTVHTGAVRAAAFVAERRYQATGYLRPAVQNPYAQPIELTDEDRARVESAIAPSRFLERYALWLGQGKNEIRLAWLSWLLGEGDEAEKHLVKALEALPENTLLRSDAALFYLARGNTDAAVRWLRESVESDPTREASWGQLASAYALAGRYDEADKVLLEAIEVVANPVIMRVERGNLALMQRDMAAAVDRFSEAVSADPASFLARLNLGAALKGQGKVDEAIGHLLEAVRLEPNSPQAHTQLGVAFVEARDYSEAVLALERAIELDPGQYEANLVLAQLYETMGRADDAAKARERAAQAAGAAGR